MSLFRFAVLTKTHTFFLTLSISFLCQHKVLVFFFLIFIKEAQASNQYYKLSYKKHLHFHFY